ncbi:MAG: type I methionyl aminopeptidase [Candidatus Melainabacteria bacterium GWF2_37_15]|nr:MAG: type I methionyl aminopeptidase [Candidatus Melainabacteria bacterium GWF2_37_15]
MITRKSKYEISLMKTAGSIVAEVLETMKEMVQPGVSTLELDEKAEQIILSHNAVPAFKGYHGFPGTICASINEQVVHGIPSKNVILKEGDIISVDVGSVYKGLVGDSAITLPVGEISDELKKLLEVTEQALYDGIKQMLPGNKLYETVSAAIENCAKPYGYGIVKQYGGHGVGRNMHEEPFVYNFHPGQPGPELRPGMVIAIEPMFNLGTGDVHVLSDKWTVVTNDKKHSAHFEHTVLVTDDEPVILTQRL